MRKRALGSLLIGGVLSAVMSLAVILPSSAATGEPVRIKNFGNNLCLQPAGDSAALGTAIVQEPCSSDPAQI
jgi:hypothetical protein